MGKKFPEMRFDGFSEEWEQLTLGELFKRVNERNSGEFNKSFIGFQLKAKGG